MQWFAISDFLVGLCNLALFHTIDQSLSLAGKCKYHLHFFSPGLIC